MIFFNAWNQFISNGDKLIHGRAVHEGVKYSFGKCVYQSSSKAYIAQYKSALHEG